MGEQLKGGYDPEDGTFYTPAEESVPHKEYPDLVVPIDDDGLYGLPQKPSHRYLPALSRREDFDLVREEIRYPDQPAHNNNGEQ
jgi:hypothetical protein